MDPVDFCLVDFCLVCGSSSLVGRRFKVPPSMVWLVALLACWHPAARPGRHGFLSGDVSFALDPSGLNFSRVDENSIHVLLDAHASAPDQIDAESVVRVVDTRVQPTAVCPMLGRYPSHCWARSDSSICDTSAAFSLTLQTDVVRTNSIRTPYELHTNTHPFE